jgi:hypothetical protein
LAIVPAVAVAPAGTSRLRPDALETVTFVAGQFVGSLEVTVPGDIEVNVTGYGFVLADEKNTSPCVKPGYRSAAPVAALTVIVVAVNALALPDPVPVELHIAKAAPATRAPAPTITAATSFFGLLMLILVAP